MVEGEVEVDSGCDRALFKLWQDECRPREVLSMGRTHERTPFETPRWHAAMDIMVVLDGKTDLS